MLKQTPPFVRPSQHRHQTNQTNREYVVFKITEYLPPSLRNYIQTQLRSLRQFLIENGVLPDTSTTGESKAVTDARNRLTTAKNERDARQMELNTSEEDLRKDYGPGDIFRALKGTCISKDSGEYTYELCWMEHTTQKPKKGGMDTTMGYFTRLDEIEVDEEERPDGKGLGSGKRVALRYENGAHCWNGPARSTVVILACAESSEIWKVVEEEKCSYRMEAGTPAVCEPQADEKEKRKKGGKDEL